MIRKVYEIPYGTKDILPGEMKVRRTIENNILAVFEKWGYEEVKTPSFEYADIFKLANKESDFQFFDRNNNLLALRNDMTAPIARIVANRLQGGNKIKRLCYISNLYRYESIQAGRQCEFEQAGVELFGAGGAAADAEIIALAGKCLQRAGLQKFSISIGHIGFINGVAEETGLNDEQIAVLKGCLRRHDAVGIQELAETFSGIDIKKQDVLRRLLFLQGDIGLIAELEEIFTGDTTKQALAELKKIYQLVTAYGLADCIKFDLGLNRSLDYYTGMLFEIYLPGIGFSVAGGGRYDKMMDNFNISCPATGFALGIDRIMLALAKQKEIECHSKWDVFVAYSEGSIETAIKKAEGLRSEGKSVRMAVEPMNLETAAVEAEKNSCSCLVYV